MLLKFCRFFRLIQDLAVVHPQKEEKIGACSPVVGVRLSCLVGCFAKVDRWRGSPRSAAVATSRAETPALLAGDFGLGFSPWQSTESDDSDAHPKLGWRFCVSGQRLRVGRLRSETPVLRGQRLWSVWLSPGMPEAWTAQTPVQNWAGDFCLRPETPVLGSLRAETPALQVGDSGPSQPATATFRGGLYKAFFYL
jgi:hypothetical protein